MKNVLVLLAPGFEETEAVSVIDILRRAEIKVTIAGLEKDTIKGSHGISLRTDIFYENVPLNDYDVLFLPGGQPGAQNLKNDRKVLNMVQQFDKQGKLIAAICAAPIVLHEAGILTDKHITSYPSEEEKLLHTNYHIEDVIRDGNIITSRGVGTTLDFALTLVEIIKGKDSSDQLAERILWKKRI